MSVKIHLFLPSANLLSSALTLFCTSFLQTSLFESMGARSQQPASQRPASLDMEDDEDEDNLVASLQATGTGRGRGGRGGRGAATGGARGRGRGKEAAGTTGRRPSQR